MIALSAATEMGVVSFLMILLSTIRTSGTSLLVIRSRETWSPTATVFGGFSLSTMALTIVIVSSKGPWIRIPSGFFSCLLICGVMLWILRHHLKNPRFSTDLLYASSSSAGSNHVGSSLQSSGNPKRSRHLPFLHHGAHARLAGLQAGAGAQAFYHLLRGLTRAPAPGMVRCQRTRRA